MTCANPWSEFAERVLAGDSLTRAEALQVLHCPDDDLLDLLAAAYRVRRQYWGKEVQLYKIGRAHV